ncbi:hypothetical protein [Hoeflea prorocentri]|uniref:Uncharacterized protein n=1 Tax=Hoeflea prorocentri TaxID=1922333 RepID=A0A9X3ZJK7_9HYPH|nr:hypothetical protein [Hoeflea prorocentri]MCY6383086.1 hypothetical protein [Hoeflea prorocentri]MDA5400886.1 hypothetical protein [Hoeflea prorocentri]
MGGKKALKEIDATWIPGESVGPIVLGNPAESISSFLTVERKNYDCGPEDETFCDVDDEWMISAENGYISTIACFRKCVYEGVNLVGLPIEDCLERLGCDRNKSADDSVWFEDGDQDVYEVDSLGAQIWVFKGRVDSIAVMEIYDEDGVTVIHPFRKS